MKTSITKGLSPERVKTITEDFGASSVLRERIISLMNEKLIASRKSSISKDMYDKPSWAYLQADQIGYERALNEIISLISD